MSEDRTTPTMEEERPSEVLGSLPRSRPHRRSGKRSTREVRATGAPARETAKADPTPDATAPATATVASGKSPRSVKRSAPRGSKTSTAAEPRGASRRSATTLRQPPQPGGVPPQPDASGTGARDHGPDIVRTAVQAAAELAEIGLSASARALRGAVSRLPRP